MRTVLMLAVVLIVSLLIFRGYPAGPAVTTGQDASAPRFDPVSKAESVDAQILDATDARRQAIENQLRQ